MKNKEKKVQINESLFNDLVKFFLEPLQESTYEQRVLVSRIINSLKDKQEALKKHEQYTTFKKADDPEEKEIARQQYLDLAGIPQSFRTDKNKNNNDIH